MSLNWIDSKEFSFNCVLLMDRWLVRYILEGYKKDREYRKHLGIALKYNPAVAWYCRAKAPEVQDTVDALASKTPDGLPPETVRAAEIFILDRVDWAVVLVYPEIMNSHCPYIYNWDEKRLFELADFTDKLVLDVGAGTGRLTFAAAKKSRRVYASEPVDELREFMRGKIRSEGIKNVTVLDGTVTCLPFEDGTFDIVMSGHVVGDDYDAELRELERVAKNGGHVLDCIGENSGKDKPDKLMLKHGFEYLYYQSKTGGDIYRYRKQIIKN